MRKKSAVKTWSTPVTEEQRKPVPCTLCGGESFKPSLSCDGFAYVACVHCSLVQMNPQPCVALVEQRYRELFGRDYLAYELENEAAFLDLQKRALKDAGFEQLEKEIMAGREQRPCVLDIGCATGALLAFLQDRGWQAAGVEISPSADYAQERLGIPISSKTLEDSHFPDEYFDLVHASHLIEHLTNPRAFLSEVRRIMRPGGYCMITTPNIDGLQAHLFSHNWRSAIFDHLYLFSARTLKKLLVDSGFTVEGIYTWGGLAAGTAPLFIKRCVDKAAKLCKFGDVMLVKSRKLDYNIVEGEK